jgi:hypothetical protein
MGQFRIGVPARRRRALLRRAAANGRGLLPASLRRVLQRFWRFAAFLAVFIGVAA